MPDPHNSSTTALLSPGEPHPLELFNETGQADYVIVCEHAGRLIPASLEHLGLPEAERTRHIAYDIGAREVAIALARLLDAPLFMQRYSRLVCDCNRRPDVESFTPATSEATAVPGNENLSAKARDMRADGGSWPFHHAIGAALDARQQAGKPTRLVTVHSFTAVFLGQSRPWDIGVLYNRDRAFAPKIGKWLEQNSDLCLGINQPYTVSDQTDYAIPVHGEQRGIDCVEFEIRNDHIADSANAPRWAAILRDAIHGALTI